MWSSTAGPHSLQAASARRRRLRDWSPVGARRRWLGSAQARGVGPHRVQPDALPVGHRRARRLRARQRRASQAYCKPPQHCARPRRLRPRARLPRPEAGPLHRLRHADLRKVLGQPGHRGRGCRAAGRVGRRPAQARQLLQRAGEGGGAARRPAPLDAGRQRAGPAAPEAGGGWGAQRTVQARYADMGKALNATGRPIVYSMCEWGVSSPWVYGREVRWPLRLIALDRHRSTPSRPKPAHTRAWRRARLATCGAPARTSASPWRRAGTA